MNRTISLIPSYTSTGVSDTLVLLHTMTTTMRHFAHFATLACLALIATTTGCKKQGTDSVMAAANNSLALMLSEDIRTQVHMAASAQMGLLNKTEVATEVPACATVTLTDNAGSYPKTLTITYGNSCMDNNGVVRQGKLVCTFSGPYDAAGSTIDIMPLGYGFDQYMVEGANSITVNGTTGPYAVTVIGLTVTWDGSSIAWSGSREVEWEGGTETQYFTPDTSLPGDIMGYTAFGDDTWYIISGSGSGNDRDGHPYNYSVASHLHSAMDCRYITEGEISLISANRTDAIVDYGNGDCDNRASLDADGDVNNFILP